MTRRTRSRIAVVNVPALVALLHRRPELRGIGITALIEGVLA